MTARRTEPPTPRRLREARARGEVARSVDLSAAAALGGGLVALSVCGSSIAATLARALRDALAAAATAPIEPAARVSDALALVLRLSLPVGACALMAGALATALQTGFGFFPRVLRPALTRLDPLRGL